MRRLLVVSMIAIALISTGLSHISASPGYESEFLSRLNNERTSRGLNALPSDPELVEVARRHSERMASEKRLYHNPNLRNEVSNWTALGENVGRGPDVASIHQAFMDSSGHRAQILDGDYQLAGVGVVAADGEIWVTQVFVRRGQATTTATSEPKPAAAAPKASRPRIAVLSKSSALPATPAPVAPVEPEWPRDLSVLASTSNRMMPLAIATPLWTDTAGGPSFAGWAASLLLLVGIMHLGVLRTRGVVSDPSR